MTSSPPVTWEPSEERTSVQSQTPGRRATFEEPSSLNRRTTRQTTADTAQVNGHFGSGNRRKASQGFVTRVASTLSAAAKRESNLGEAPGFWTGLRAVVTASWLNVLLIFIPLSWAFHFAKPDSHTLIFVFAFLAIIPLAKLLAFATDEISMRFGQTIAGLLNATLGNAVELIVAIIALTKCQLSVVQSSLIGSILSNLLLVLGMCFFAGGTRFSEQGFGAAAAQINSSLLTLSVIAVLLPAAFNQFTADTTDKAEILSLSHGVAVILLFIYIGYIIFQLWSHTHLYEDRGEDVKESTRYKNVHRPDFMHFHNHKRNDEDSSNIPLHDQNAATTSTASNDVEASSPPQEEEETPQMSMLLSIVVLAAVTVLVAITAEFLVDSINGLTEGGHISKVFVGLILLPIVGNAAEHVTAVTVSLKDKLTLSIGVAVGSSIQIALFVIPFIVILAWIMGKPLTLLFDPFQSITLFLAVLTVNYAVADGKSNWLEGLILMSLYLILGVSFWFYQAKDDPILSTCH